MMDVPKDDGKATNGSKRKTSVAVEKPSKSLKNDKGKWIVPPLLLSWMQPWQKSFLISQYPRCWIIPRTKIGPSDHPNIQLKPQRSRGVQGSGFLPFPLDMNDSPMYEASLSIRASQNEYTPADRHGLVKKPIKALSLNLVISISRVSVVHILFGFK